PRAAALGGRRPRHPLGGCPDSHGRAGERERQAQRPTRRGARNARRELVAAGGRSEQPSGSAARAALPRIVRRSRHGLPGQPPGHLRRAPRRPSPRDPRAARGRGLAGLEYAEGIPGTVGGALFMNAGAYGGELAPAVESVEGLGRDGRAFALPDRELVFGYRHSALPPGFVVTAVRLRLRRDESGQVRNRMDEARPRTPAALPHGGANAA